MIIDVNECLFDPPCLSSERCVNTEGSYTCNSQSRLRCYNGYEVDARGTTCVGKLYILLCQLVHREMSRFGVVCTIIKPELMLTLTCRKEFMCFSYSLATYSNMLFFATSQAFCRDFVTANLPIPIFQCQSIFSLHIIFTYVNSYQ